jgi:hypothetical protein
MEYRRLAKNTMPVRTFDSLLGLLGRDKLKLTDISK